MMPISNRPRVMGAALAGILITAIVAVIVRTKPAERPSATLEPAPSTVAYRFAIHGGNPRAELDDTIAAVEARQHSLPNDPLEMTELANLYAVRGQLDGDRRDLEEAERLAHRSLEILPAPNGAVMTLARLANARHDFRVAIELTHQYRGRNPVAVPMVLATTHLALGELEQAAEAADVAVADKPSPSAYLERALIMQAQGRDPEAAADFASAVRVEEADDVLESARVRALWGRFLLRRGLYRGAAMVIDEALRIAPASALALSIRGELEMRTGDPAAARATFEQAFVGSHQTRYLIDQSRALELAGDRAGADALRAKVEMIVRDDLASGGNGHRLELVEVMVDGGEQLTEAIALAREEVARRPSADSRYQLARALAATGELHEAMVQIRAVLASGAREAQFYELAARLEMKTGNFPRSSLYEQLADALDPRNAGWRSLGLR